MGACQTFPSATACGIARLRIKCANEMRGWLNMHVGRGQYFVWSETNPGIPEAALFYFESVEMARAFVDRFARGVVLLQGRESDRPP